MNPYEIITESVIKRIEAGGIPPWRKPWIGGETAPKNLVSKKEYRGINVFLLSCAGYQSPYWLTFRQANELGGSVKKGEKGTPVVFWRMLSASKDKKEGENAEQFPMMRYYTVFNTQQCDGITAPDVATPRTLDDADSIDTCETIVDGYRNKPGIKYGMGQAYYSRANDTIGMPDRQLFTGSGEFYSTLFHEMAHSTGHELRLNRKELQSVERFGDREYSKEELIAEFASSFLCATAGISPAVIDNQSAYISGWLSKLRGDSRLLIVAASAAQKASDYILGVDRGKQGDVCV